MDKMELSQKIRKYRLQIGFTAEQLAEKAGYSEGHIRQLEAGQLSLTLRSLIDIANALKIPPSYLIYDETPLDLSFVQSLTPCELEKLTLNEVKLLISVMEAMAKDFGEDNQYEASVEQEI